MHICQDTKWPARLQIPRAAWIEARKLPKCASIQHESTLEAFWFVLCALNICHDLLRCFLSMICQVGKGGAYRLVDFVLALHIEVNHLAFATAVESCSGFGMIFGMSAESILHGYDSWWFLMLHSDLVQKILAANVILVCQTEISNCFPRCFWSTGSSTSLAGWENLQDTPTFHSEIHGFRVFRSKFSQLYWSTAFPS